MTRHELKTVPRYFYRLWDGSKKFEVRRNDRGFEVGDILILRESDVYVGQFEGGYSGREVVAKITYIFRLPELIKLSMSQQEYVVMGIRIYRKSVK